MAQGSIQGRVRGEDGPGFRVLMSKEVLIIMTELGLMTIVKEITESAYPELFSLTTSSFMKVASNCSITCLVY